MSDLSGANARRAMLVLGVAVAIVVIVGLAIGLLVGQPLVAVVAGLVVGIALALWVRSRATDIVINATGARRADPGEHPRLHNLVDGLCMTSGVPTPELYVTDDAALNVMVAGRDQRRSAVVFTTGLLEGLDRIELEGVVAHQLARIRHDDVAPATLVAVLGRLTGPVLRTPLAADRLSAADLEACQLTRYPPGLIRALEKMSGHSAMTSGPPSNTAHLWFAPVGGGHAETHPPLEERIALLREL